MKTIAIIQSNYIPWKGYFDIISQVDEFILYDCAQYTARTWRNRNLIKTHDGPLWLTIPVHHDYQNPRSISETHVSNQHWRKKHWKNLVQNYSRAPYFKEYSALFEGLYLGRVETSLSEINYTFILAVVQILAIKTPIIRMTDHALTGDKNHDLIEICKMHSADAYLSGPAGKKFLSEEVFAHNSIELKWMEYKNYPVYDQFHPPFVHQISILDLIFHVGPDARKYI